MFPFRKKPSTVPRPDVRPIAPYRFGHTLDYFRSQPDRIDGMREFLRGALGQQMMSVLQHEVPLDSIDAVKGHRRCMRLIELMATDAEKSKEDIEATFGAEEVSEPTTEPPTTE